jgi:outer membrane protein TolC
MNTSKIIACGATLLLSSCGIYTSYEPQTSVPENLYDEEVTVSDTASIGNIHWRDFFTDPYLQDLIEKGLAQNTDVQTASLRVEEAKASLLSAKLAFLPSFALSPQGGINTVEGSKASHTYTLPVTASWELDIFGKLRNAKRQAKAAYLQSEDYKQAVYSSLIANIANTYYTLLMLDEQLEISRQTADTWVQQVLPDTKMGNGFTASQITVGAKCDSDATWNGWLNKLFVVVDVSHGRAIALYNHDGEFHIYRHSGN